MSARKKRKPAREPFYPLPLTDVQIHPFMPRQLQVLRIRIAEAFSISFWDLAEPLQQAMEIRHEQH